MQFLPGETVGGLEILGELGRGAFGVVYLARDKLIGRRVALKVLPGGKGEVAQERRETTLQEARMIGSLQSPYVVTLYQLRTATDGGLMLEMECVEGGSLEDDIGEDGVLPLDRSLTIFRQTLLGLRAAHDKRVIHGDIKPANVLFDREGRVKLTDFGLARMLEGTNAEIQLEGQLFGTPAYMAPEVLRGQSAGIPSDLWAAAGLFHRIVTGCSPFPARTIPELFVVLETEEPTPLPDDVPEDLRAVVARCLAKDTSARWASADEILAALDAIEPAAAVVGAAAVGFAPREAVRSISDLRTNVSPPATSLLGRDKELAALDELFKDDGVRLVTLTGPGGIGKTALSRTLCRRAAPGFPGGCWFVELSAVTTEGGVAQAVAQTLGVPLAGDDDPVAQAAGLMTCREPMLLVLDNFEQVTDHAGATVGRWLEEVPDVRFLVTSRVLLGLAGEREREQRPLAAPGEQEATGLDPQTALDWPAVALYVERAREVDARFQLTEGMVADVARIGRELDGIPLAIELAAARSRIMKPAQVASRLTKRFQLLSSSSMDLSPRQRTMLGAIDWSFNLLDDWEQAAFLQACAFVGGFSLDAAEAVIDITDYIEAPLAMDAMQSLREKSLVTTLDVGEEMRFRMYGSIREYGLRKLAETMSEYERASLYARHADYYLGYVTEWAERIPGPDEREALDRLEVDSGNLATVVDRRIETGAVVEAADVALGLARMMRVRRPARELLPILTRVIEALPDDSPAGARLAALLADTERRQSRFDAALAAARRAVAGAADPAARASALFEQGETLRLMGRTEEALVSLDASIEAAGAVGGASDAVLGAAHLSRGSVAWARGDRESAAAHWHAAEPIARRVGDNTTLVRYLLNLGVIAETKGDLTGAILAFEDAEDLARRTGDRAWVAFALANRAASNMQAGRVEEALAAYREAEVLARVLGDLSRLSEVLGNRGSAHALREEPDEALECYREAERIAREIGDKRRIALSLGQRGILLSKKGRNEEALRCFEDAGATAEEIGDFQGRALQLSRQGSIHRSLGNLDEAADLLDTSVSIYRDLHAMNVPSFRARVALAQVANERGDTERTVDLAREAQELADRLGLTDEHPAPSIRESVAFLESVLRE